MEWNGMEWTEWNGMDGIRILPKGQMTIVRVVVENVCPMNLGRNHRCRRHQRIKPLCLSPLITRN